MFARTSLSPGQTIATLSATYPNIVGHNMLSAFGHPVATCCNMLRVVGSFLKLVKFEPTTPNMSQHMATRWPNARNMLCPTMLRYVVLACCDRLAGALYTESKYHINHFVLIAYGNLLRKSRTKHRSRLLKYMLNTLLNTFSYLNCGKIVNNKQTTHPKSQKLQQPNDFNGLVLDVRPRIMSRECLRYVRSLALS